VTLIVSITKFTKGAWVPIVVVPLLILLFKAIKRHYVTVSEGLEIEPADLPAPPARHTFVVLVGRVHRGVVDAIQYAQALRPDHVTALHIADEVDDHEQVQADWLRYGFDVPLEIVDSPYRELSAPVLRYLDRLEARWETDRLTVVIPEFVVGVKSVTNILHGQNGLALKLALLDRPNTAVTSVPFHLRNATLPRARSRVVPLEQLDQRRRTTRVAAAGDGVATRPIAGLPLRVPITFTGEVVAARVVPREGSPWLELTVDDGTGHVIATFTGRQRIIGLEPGRLVALEGVAREERGRLLMLNPLYTLLP
jgi:hypothetical protein